MSRSPHTHFTKGKRVLVILRDGQRYVDRWVGKSQDDRSVRLADHGTVLIRTIRSIGIYKGDPSWVTRAGL